MTKLPSRLSAVALLFAVAAVPAWAASSASSAVSDSLTTSSGSVSNSIQRSSDSSSGKDEKVAEGDYKIIEVAAAPARPGTVRLKLQPVVDVGGEAAKATKGEFFLFMPQEAFDQSRLGPGHVVTAKPRAYGLQFTQAASQKVFFLVLDDEQYRELQTKVVSL
jgi:hypothetical protein